MATGTSKTGATGQTTTIKRAQYLDGFADLITSRKVVEAALSSSSGIVRLTTQAGTADEVKALANLASDSTAVGKSIADLVTRANLGPASGSIAGITSSSTWANLVTAIAAS